MVKNLRAMREDLILILGLGRSLGEGNGYPLQDSWGILGGSDGKESACNTEDLGLIPGLGRSLGEGNGYPLQYFCLENSKDTGAWQTTVRGVAKSQTQLSNFHTYTHQPS